VRERAEKEWSGRLEGRERGRNGRRGGEEVARGGRKQREGEACHCHRACTLRVRMEEVIS
jgi:hypothetical protein